MSIGKSKSESNDFFLFIRVRYLFLEQADWVQRGECHVPRVSGNVVLVAPGTEGGNIPELFRTFLSF